MPNTATDRNMYMIMCVVDDVVFTMMLVDGKVLPMMWCVTVMLCGVLMLTIRYASTIGLPSNAVHVRQCIAACRARM